MWTTDEIRHSTGGGSPFRLVLITGIGILFFRRPFAADGWQRSFNLGTVRDFLICTTVDIVYRLHKTRCRLLRGQPRILKQRGRYESSRWCLQVAIRCRGRPRRACTVENSQEQDQCSYARGDWGQIELAMEENPRRFSKTFRDSQNMVTTVLVVCTRNRFENGIR